MPTMTTALIATTMLLAQGPGPVAIETLITGPAAVRKMDKVDLRAVEDGREVTYTGVPLAAILDLRANAAGGMAGLKALSDAVLLVRADDGYQVAFSAAEVAMDPKGERFLLATARDGKPLDDDRGPLRMIVPADPKHVRWIKNVASVRLVRLDKLAGPADGARESR